jgi:hypothetical protein
LQAGPNEVKKHNLTSYKRMSLIGTFGQINEVLSAFLAKDVLVRIIAEGKRKKKIRQV